MTLPANSDRRSCGREDERCPRKTRGLRRAAWALLLAGGLASACRPENTHYSAVSVLCAEAMRIHLKGQNVAKILRFSERDAGLRSQILFELSGLDDTRRQSAAACAFSRDDKNRMVLAGASLDGRALDAAELAQLSDQLMRGTR